MGLPLVGRRRVGAVFLNVQSEEADFDAFDHFEREDRLRPVRELLGNVRRTEPEHEQPMIQKKIKNATQNKMDQFVNADHGLFS